MMEIREAKLEDALQLFEAEKEWAKVPGFLVSHPSELMKESFAKTIGKLADSTNGKYLVAEQGGQIIAHAMLDPMGLRSICHIVRLTIVVHKGFENKGVGKQLMNKLVKWARGNSEVDKIELNVRASNERAIKLYRSLGFEEEGLLKRRIKTPEGEYIDELLMGLWTKNDD